MTDNHNAPNNAAPNNTAPKNDAFQNIVALLPSQHMERAAIVQDGVTMSRQDLQIAAGNLRAFLADRSIGPGDKVAVAAGSEAEFCVALLGVLGVGAALVPMNPKSPPAEINRQLETINPRLVLLSTLAAPMARRAAEITSNVVALTEIPPVDPLAHPPIASRQPGDLALLMLTSGTAGVPKAAMISQRNLNWTTHALGIGHSDGLKESDIALATLPTAHIFGLLLILTALRQGSVLVFQTAFDIESSLDLTRRHGVTVLNGAPPMWRGWADAVGSDDRLSSVRRGLSGAAALPEQTFDDIQARYGFALHEGYGMTETCAVISSSLGHQPRRGSVGRVFDGLEMVLVDDSGDVVQPGDTGEIAVRGPNVFSGYWHDQEATDLTLSPDGWLWTGDAGIVDQDGWLWIVDRLKDVVNVSGFNVYPSEVEEIIATHPQIAAAVVSGAPHARRGETVVAHVRAATDQSVNTDQVLGWLRERLSHYKIPTEITVVADLPISPAGKVARRSLR